ncbi:MAG: threonylcarbamoyl-AMP synthase [Chloroflexi bacterium]|nr:threonylcarbamoyl-AMP synthase [Chloroflexota bacterium]
MVATQLLSVDPIHPDAALLAIAAHALRQGALVAFPTETVYGLGANALDPSAVDRIFAAKQRPFTDPLIVHLAGVEQLDGVARTPPTVAYSLAALCWPGPLTLVLQRADRLAPNLAAGRPTVAVRVPAHPVALGLLRACQLPIAAPSANLFSRPSPTTAQHVLKDLAGRIEFVLDGGPTPIGLESTVIDLTQEPPRLLRHGGADLAPLLQLLPDLQIPTRPLIAAESAPAPGTQLRHYAPHTPLLLVSGHAAAAQNLLDAALETLSARGLRAGLLLPDEELPRYPRWAERIVALGPGEAPEQVGRTLFTRLRQLDELAADVVLARPLPQTTAGLGPAVQDRLFRAAEGHTVDAETPAALSTLLELVEQLLPGRMLTCQSGERTV